MRALELEEVVEQRHEEGFACFGPEDPLEDNVGLGVGEDGEHGPEALSPERAGRWSRKAKSRAADMLGSRAVFPDGAARENARPRPGSGHF